MSSAAALAVALSAALLLVRRRRAAPAARPAPADTAADTLARIPAALLAATAHVYRGAMLHSLSFDHLQVLPDAVLAVDAAGRILFFSDASAPISASATAAAAAARGGRGRGDDMGVAITTLTAHQFLCPGFVDAHAHAPQHAFTGTALDLPLLEWLQTYTFPHEARFSDLAHARAIYERAVHSHLRNGSTTVSYFATIHVEACKLLVDIVREQGQRALVGKVNMDRNAPDDYVETTEASLSGTQAFIDYVLGLRDPLVTPVITPRFVPTCTPALMRGLGALAARHRLPVQSHLGETVEECAWVRGLHPECDNYADVYVRHGLMPVDTPVYMAHCIHCGGPERGVLQARGCGIVHCPNSNFTLGSGVCNVRQWVGEGHKVGMGTDVAGGYSPSMLDAIRNARVASVAVTQISGRQNSKVVQDMRLSYAQLFYLATLGGAVVVGMEGRIGNFKVGKELDALVVDTAAEGSPTTTYAHDKLLDRFQKFLFLGDDRNIVKCIVKGKVVLEKKKTTGGE
jgi:guanine deaminase